MINGMSLYQSRVIEYSNTPKGDETNKVQQSTKGAVAQIEEAIETQRAEVARKAEAEAQNKENNPPGSREWIA